MTEIKNKSQSKKIRDILFRLWERNNQGYDDFEAYYKNRTGDIIEDLMRELDDAPLPTEEGYRISSDKNVVGIEGSEVMPEYCLGCEELGIIPHLKSKHSQNQLI